MNHRLLSRRSVLQAAVAAGAAPLFSACGNGSGGDGSSGAATTDAASPSATPTTPGAGSPSAAPSSGGSSTLPAYVPRVVAPPDLPGSDSGLPPAYLTYPANPQPLAATPPAGGGSISVLKLIQSAAPPAEGKNQFWQQLNKRVGAELKITSILANQYWAKVTTTIAGGDIPDITTFNTSSTTPSHLPDVMKAKFQDLTPYLAGDAVKAYPNLAALQTIAWRSPIFDGKIYGVPLSQSVIGNTGKIRQDVLQALDIDPTPADGQEFLALCKSLTDERKSRWSLGRISDAMNWVGEMVGAPNQWRVDNGAFTSQYATDEYKQMLDTVRQMWSAGYFHPDTLTATAAQIRTWFLGGTVPMMFTNYTDWTLLTESALPTNPNFKVGGLIPPKWDGGGQAGHYEIKGSWTYVALKQGDEKRTRELLSVLDWFAAPFGSEEYLFLNYGIPGRDYTLKGSDPIETSTGVNECQDLAITYLAAPPDTLYIPGQADLTKAQHDSLAQLMTATVPLPTVGLVSDTAQSKGATIEKDITSLYTDIIAGRKPLSAWDAGVKSWRSNGGEQIGHEYEQAYANRPK